MMKWELMRRIVGGTTLVIALGLGAVTISQTEERSISAPVESGAPAGEGNVQPRGLPVPQITLPPLKQLQLSQPNFPVRLVESVGHRFSPPFFGSNPVAWNATRQGYVVTVNFPASLRLTFQSTSSVIYPAQAYTGTGGNRYVAEANNDNLQYFLLLPVGNSFASQVVAGTNGLTIVHLGAPGFLNELTITVAKRTEAGVGLLTPLYSFPVFLEQP
jgi:hypothetical protein